MIDTKYYLESLNRQKSIGPVSIYYNYADEIIANKALNTINYAKRFINWIFNINPSITITIFIYHDLNDMNMAFERLLPHDQCCFIPIHGEHTLITFTSKIGINNLLQLLVHEYCHIVFGKVTNNTHNDGFKQSIPLWIDEGLSLFLDFNFRVNIEEVLSKRLLLFQNEFSRILPCLSNQYEYFNRLDGNIEFGPRGMLAYAFSYFCVLDLFSSHSKSKIFKFIFRLNPEMDIETLFLESFGYSLISFDKKMRSKLSIMSQNTGSSVKELIKTIKETDQVSIFENMVKID